jgi:hypothetical protein
MAALVAYPAASRPDRALRRQRTPQSKIGWDSKGSGDTRALCDLEFKIACMFLQQAILSVFTEPCKLTSVRDVCVFEWFLLRDKSLRAVRIATYLVV